MDVDVDKLVQMGFEREQAEKAIIATHRQGAGAALQWLILNEGHEDDAPPILPNSSKQNVDSGNVDNLSAAPQAAHSTLKGGDSVKVTQQNEQKLRAAKTRVPVKQALSMEQRKAQLRKLDEKLKQKRLEREAQQKKRVVVEKNMEAAHRKMQMKLAREVIHEKRREEQAERWEHQRLLRNIAAEKAAKKVAPPKNEKAHEPVKVDKSQAPPKHLEKNPNPIADSLAGGSETKSEQSGSLTFRQIPTRKRYTHTHIQVRLFDGTTIRQTFRVGDPLSALDTFIKRSTGIAEPYKLVTNFPHRVFEAVDYRKTLHAVGLAPTAVVYMMKEHEIFSKN